VVRLEVATSVGLERARQLADLATAVVPRFATVVGRDPRAPQNLYPVAGLERALRRRLGEPTLLYRALRRAAAAAAA
jgi:hypothetical protein